MQILHSPEDAARWLRGRVTGTLTADSRNVQAGDGFIAWPGAATDGRQYVSAALRNGASACLVEDEGVGAFVFDLGSSESIASFEKLKAATGLIASAYYEAPSKSLAVIAITGTNGKTSTAWWLAHALSNLPGEQSLPCAMVGTLGIAAPRRSGAHAAAAGEFYFDLVGNGLTTPDPVLLQQSFSSFASQGVKACALEASSIGIEEQRLAGTCIQVAVFTNFTQDHLDYHGSMAAYWQAKASLFQWPGLKAVIINADDERGAQLALTLANTPQQTQLDTWTVSCKTAARLCAQDIRYDASGLRFTVVEAGRSIELNTRLVGHYNVANLLGVMAAMRALGVSLESCVDACRRLPAVPGRMQCQGGAGEPLAVVDYAHTPDALAQALAALRPLAQTRGGKLWCVFGCGGNRDATKRPLMGAVAAQHADRVIVTSDNPRNEPPQAIISQILIGVAGDSSVEVESDRARAISQVIGMAQIEDVVLVAGKGHEDYQEVMGQKLLFSDQEHIQMALQARRNAVFPEGLVS